MNAKKLIPVVLELVAVCGCDKSDIIIDVQPCQGDATEVLGEAIAKAATFGERDVTIRLAPGDYHISRDKASKQLYYISNTSSASENPDQTKHIGLWFRKMSHVTFDGNGARLVTHGEMTSIVVDSCSDVSLKNFTLTAADPSVPEIKILEADNSRITFHVTEPSDFDIADGHFNFKGEGWVCADGGRMTSLPQLAQVFYPDSNVTLRCDFPFDDYTDARLVGDRTVEMSFDKVPDVHPGEIYQIRHGIRNEACGLIANSRNVSLENIEFNFMGNFGLVGQYSENISYDNIRCRPDSTTERTNAGFADFVQMSGCKGKIRIANSYFEGSHDDPINIHGTHLRAVGRPSPERLLVRFMHHQSYGFTPFHSGDSVGIVDVHSLLYVDSVLVEDVRRIDEYEFELTFDRSLSADCGIEDIAVENISWTPEVEIVGNYFARTPTRGILITTRGRSLIEGNTFYRIPMASILVADDAQSWYESGPVRDLTIRRNVFVECAAPVIDICPENDRDDGPVHRNITIEDNKFVGIAPESAIAYRSVANMTVRNNSFTEK